jgi:hypothetical protein
MKHKFCGPEDVRTDVEVTMALPDLPIVCLNDRGLVIAPLHNQVTPIFILIPLHLTSCSSYASVHADNRFPCPSQRPPPGDTDLQELYDQVLSAFAEESSPSNFSPTFSISRSNNVDPDSLYSLHSDEGVGSQVSSRPSLFLSFLSLSSYLSSSF